MPGDTTLAEVRLWGTRIGAVALGPNKPYATFQYDSGFITSGIQVAPLTMPLSAQVYAFAGLALETFHGLPGLLADALPDKFGTALIDAWLATQGKDADRFNAVERLCYTGIRGMGALEFAPTIGPRLRRSRKLRVDALVSLASEILRARDHLRTTFAGIGQPGNNALRDILRVGTSAGGARAKAVIAWNRKTHEVRSGQVESGDDFEYWLLKFDGVSDNKDRELDDPQGYGAIEYAYALMAKAAGIEMSECRLMEENGRRHFMIRRFDRTPEGEKLHMQSLCAIAHYDFNRAGAYAYEQALGVISRLGLPHAAAEEQFRRMLFNIVARNQDDHVKNIAFLMDRGGRWSLSPAFDLIWSYNPDGAWTSTHQMTCNGKRDGFVLSDFDTCAKNSFLKRGRSRIILNEVKEAVDRWPEFAKEAGVRDRWHHEIGKTHRLTFLAR